MPPKSSLNLDSPEFRSMFPSDRPHRRTIDELFDDPVCMAEFEEIRRAAAALGGDPIRESCDVCQSSPFESQATKDATYLPSKLRKHKKQHHSDSATFNTWLLFHHKHSRCFACPICQNWHSSARRLQLHLLEEHQDDIPNKLPVDIYDLAFWACMSSMSSSIREDTLLYRGVVESHVAAAAERKILAKIQGESSMGGKKEGKA